MEHGVIYTHGVARKAYKNEGAACSDVAKALAHCHRASGCIEHHISPVQASGHRRLKSHFLYELSPPFACFQYVDFGSALRRELRNCDSNWSCANDYDRISGFYRATFDRVRANAERLDECKLVQGEDRRFVQERQRNRELLLHPPVDVYPQYLNIFATVSSALKTSATHPTGEVGFDRASVAWRDTQVVR
jgi:hypothetical protein